MTNHAKTGHAKTGRAETIGLFVTCLVETFRPSVAIAAVRLLEGAGHRVVVPANQACCGQPNYNAGDRARAKAMAEGFVRAFRAFDRVVAPSGSCAAMARVHYPALLAGGPLEADARALAARVFELVQFLARPGDPRARQRPAAGKPAEGESRVTYHDSCSGLRELGIKTEPRALLAAAGVHVAECKAAETCCGFGGTFCVKYPPISERMADEKIAALAASGADTVLAGDLGCLLHLAGRARRLGRPLACRHVAEALAGMADGPAIGEPSPPDTAPAPERGR